MHTDTATQLHIKSNKYAEIIYNPHGGVYVSKNKKLYSR